MKYKLLALDIDETCTQNGVHTVSENLYKAFHQAVKKIAITFVTARAIKELQDFLDNLDMPKQYQVVENGAKVMNPDGSFAYDLHIPNDEIQEIIDAARPYYLEPGFLADEHWENNSLSEGNITGLSFSCASWKHTELLITAVSRLPHKYAIYNGRHWSNAKWSAVLVFHKDATKGKGMQYVQEKLRISKEETIAIGDGMTDESMFNAAGLKIAMENGEPGLKKAADYVCPSVTQDGVVDVIDRYV